MPVRRRIKQEPQDEPKPSPSPPSRSPSRTPSVDANRRMAPPAAPSNHGTRPFSRSHAPSIDTRAVHAANQGHRSDDMQSETTHDTPQLMELRTRNPPAHNNHQRSRSTPSSQTGDTLMVNQSFADIASKVKDCNDVLAELQQLGIRDFAQLPSLVMVGDQSAGKSSLMSGLAELDLPRSGGVCTRCPIHIRLSRHDRWSCTVSLQQDYDYQPPQGRIRKNNVSDRDPFPPWKYVGKRVKNFKSIDFEDRHQIEDVLRWAQVAILNHENPASLYVPGQGAYAREHTLQEAAEQTRAQFSPNIVALEMKGPNYPDLSFYDLPGVFSTPAQEEDEYLVEVVKNLAKYYISREEVIILWALPMNNDPETSISLGLIREAKAQGRTVGIMTKADMHRKEDITSWLSVLRGEKHRVGYGYFITSRPALDNNESLERVNQWEEQFFNANDEGWPQEFGPHYDRCGVAVLTEFLSKLLGQAFSSSLPQIAQKIREAKRDIESQLSELPELPRNVEFEVRQSLQQFKEAVKEATLYTDFQPRWSQLNKQFQACILAMKPTCLVRTPGQAPYRESLDGTVDLTSDSENVAAETPSRKRTNPRASDSTIRIATPSKRQRVEVSTPTTVKMEQSFYGMTPQSGQGTPGPDPQSPFAEFYSLSRRGLDIRLIRDVLASRRRAGMPADIVPSDVYDVLINKAITNWQKPIERYIDHTMRLFKSMLNGALSKSMASLAKRLIFDESRSYLDEYIAKMDSLQSAAIMDLFQSETYEMYTTNEDAYNRYREEELATLQRARSIERLRAIGVFSFDYKTRPLTKMTPEAIAEEKEKIAKNITRLGPDEFSHELEVAAVVRGYYILAGMRLVEGVTLSVKSKLFRDVASDNPHQFLNRKLGLHEADSDTFNRLMEEDQVTATKREQLKREKDKLEIAMQKISNLQLGDRNELLADLVGNSFYESGAVHDEVMSDEI
ncbi:hypothetical protein PFICI_14271 [Pestalotiopsis fici W106-1]|uniref:GED domain-containing protein n=1 Tax=Pestalotiopsis fici (strain W106-1 / CGMCC3.15140) TaxID=1229662 RepID=W3WKE9_PESFW|nr:uncharacterized protein PFICI_14271 [Pestalotiopsis fici W106-1]ETS74405.1 hypothetical protein PFICI_14271 [Pestalotiopsis fici W106-1]